MPIYEFQCSECGERFEELVPSSVTPACPGCGATSVDRLLSQFSPPRKIGLHGAAARRSNAIRKSREEQRREGFARNREAKAEGQPSPSGRPRHRSE